ASPWRTPRAVTSVRSGLIGTIPVAETTLSTRRSPGAVLSLVRLLSTLSRRDSILIGACIAAITALAWAYLVHVSHQMSATMEYDKAMAAMGMSTEWNAQDAVLTFAMWLVMMIGMMGPAATPVLLLFANAGRSRGSPDALLASGLFGSGYIAVWAGFSAFA